jgi:hypothetical protein
MNNSEKLATKDTQDEDKQNKNTTQYVLDTTIRKQSHNNLMVLNGEKPTPLFY